MLKGVSHDFVAGYSGSDFLGFITAQVSDSSLQRCHGECLRAKFAIHIMRIASRSGWMKGVLNMKL